MDERREFKAYLEAEDFSELIAGGEVEKTLRDGTKLKLILADIGFEFMTRLMSCAFRDRGRRFECDCGRVYRSEEALLRCQAKGHPS